MSVEQLSRPADFPFADKENRLNGFGLGVGVFGGAVLVGLHLLPRFGGVDPVRGMVSDYALTPRRWLFVLGLVASSVGSAFIWRHLVRSGVLRGPWQSGCLALWCVPLLGVAAFPKDPVGGHTTVVGALHHVCTAMVCASIPLLSLLLGGRGNGYARVVRWLALAGVPLLVPFVVSFTLNLCTSSHRFSFPGTGLVERAVILLDIAALLVLAVWSVRAGSSGSTWRETSNASRLRIGITRNSS